MSVKAKIGEIMHTVKRKASNLDDNQLKIGIIAGGIVVIILMLALLALTKYNTMPEPIEQITLDEYTQTSEYIEIAPIVAGVNSREISIETPLNNVQGKLTLAELGLDDHMLIDYAISIDLRGESTHAIAIVLPREGFEQRCEQELIHYVADKQKYTREQDNEEAYNLAKQAVINKYGDYQILVLSEADGMNTTIMDTIKKSMQAYKEGITLEELVAREEAKNKPSKPGEDESKTDENQLETNENQESIEDVEIATEESNETNE